MLGFARSAELYERARPDYPAEATDWVLEQLELGPGARVVDLGAGTGKLARRLVERGLRVTGVEPLAEMRAVFEEVVPGVEVLEGTSERIPLADGVADAVTAAQAFHWFDADRALPEIHRVLRPGGGVALIWNVRDGSHPLHRAFAELLRPYRGGTYPEQEQHGEALAASPLFGEGARRAFRHEQVLDADGLVERAASVSFVAQLPEEERADLLERVRALAPEGTFAFPYVTKVFTGRAR